MKQKACPECYFYEIAIPFYYPTHYADISHLIDEKRSLIDFHRDQAFHKDITCNINMYRGSVISMYKPVDYAECYLQADPFKIGYWDDILIKLNSFKEDYSLYDRLLEQGIRIKRVMTCDLGLLQEFIRENFADSWANEILPAVINGSCFIAERDSKILAFGCAEATAKGYLGPAGTLPGVRRTGISRALLQRWLRYMIEHNYRYAIAGIGNNTRVHENA